MLGNVEEEERRGNYIYGIRLYGAQSLSIGCVDITYRNLHATNFWK